MTKFDITLLGDGIENPHNAIGLSHAAAMFAATCLFRDRHNLSSALAALRPESPALACASPHQILDSYLPLVACENVEGAAEVYGYRLRAASRPALLVGNERHGISHELLSASHAQVLIPMAAPRLNTLNVAAAAVIALHYLARGGGAPMQLRRDPAQHRPDLLLLGGTDHVELGSTIRSAGAFGWRQLYLEDRAGVWFGSPRVARAEGRAAARSARNTIRLVPVVSQRRYAYGEVVVVNTKGRGVPLHRANLARGSCQLIAIPDESSIALEAEDWSRLATRVCYVHLDLPVREFIYQYRLVASIALAEIARQVGRTSARGAPSSRTRPLQYERTLELEVPESETGEEVLLADLQAF